MIEYLLSQLTFDFWKPIIAAVAAVTIGLVMAEIDKNKSNSRKD